MKKFLFVFFIVLSPCSYFSLTAQEAKPKPVPVKPVPELERPAIEVSVNENRLTIQNASVGQKLEVFSVVGLKVQELILKVSPAEVVLNVPKGYYILKIGETVKKVVVK